MIVRVTLFVLIIIFLYETLPYPCLQCSSLLNAALYCLYGLLSCHLTNFIKSHTNISLWCGCFCSENFKIDPTTKTLVVGLTSRVFHSSKGSDISTIISLIKKVNWKMSCCNTQQVYPPLLLGWKKSATWYPDNFFMPWPIWEWLPKDKYIQHNYEVSTSFCL